MTDAQIPPFVARLAATARSERRPALQAMIVARFREALLMEPGDELALTANYFDLGMTSLLVVGLKQDLETTLGCAIDAGTLFSYPSIEQVMAHLCEECLPDLLGTRPAGVPDDPRTAPRPVAKKLLDGLLADLYQD